MLVGVEPRNPTDTRTSCYETLPKTLDPYSKGCDRTHPSYNNALHSHNFPSIYCWITGQSPVRLVFTYQMRAASADDWTSHGSRESARW